MKPIIKVANVSKQYRLGTVGTGTIRDDFQRWWHRIQGKEDPFFKVGEVNNRSIKGSSKYVWALKDISFDVMPGDVLGIIGANGAGKSTLLKILSKVTGPTTGRIDFNGQISSLLEVGTGFHPDLTGRENIFLNGAILGMSKSDIRRKLDEIIEFSGCERYIDTPVKRYSSGMVVRLGFAVAANLKPEILIVDEVLAVGDAEFQKKAIEKMQDVNKNDGRTVLFVSHNMPLVDTFCNKGLLIENGNIKIKSNIKEAIAKYFENIKSINEKKWPFESAPGNKNIKLKKTYIVNRASELISYASVDEEIGFCIEYDLIEDTPSFVHGINVFNSTGVHLFSSHSKEVFEKKIKKGNHFAITWLPANLLQSDLIKFSFGCLRYAPFEILFYEANILEFNIIDSNDSLNQEEYKWRKLPGLIRPLLKWETSF